MHKGFTRYIPNSEYAVIMLHGIAGTPKHFEFLLPFLPQDWSIYNICLDGHSGSVADFGRSSMKKWRDQALNTMDEILSKHKYLVCVAHSMGTLFSIRGAIKHSERIKGLFLLAAPLNIRVRLATSLTTTKMMFGLASDTDKRANIMRSATGIRLESKPWKYIGWIPRMLELLFEVKNVRKLIAQLEAPCVAFQSRNDELVSLRACKTLKKSPYVTVNILEGSGHFDYGAEDEKYLQESLSAFARAIEAECSAQ